MRLFLLLFALFNYTAAATNSTNATWNYDEFREHMCYMGMIRHGHNPRESFMLTPTLGTFCTFEAYFPANEVNLLPDMIRMGVRDAQVTPQNFEQRSTYSVSVRHLASRYKKEEYIVVSYACFESKCNNYDNLKNVMKSWYYGAGGDGFRPTESERINRTEMAKFKELAGMKCHAWALNPRYRGASEKNMELQGGPCFTHVVYMQDYTTPAYLQTSQLSHNSMRNPWAILEYAIFDRNDTRQITNPLKTFSNGVETTHFYAVCFPSNETDGVCNDYMNTETLLQSLKKVSQRRYNFDPRSLSVQKRPLTVLGAEAIYDSYDIHLLWQTNNVIARTMFHERTLFHGDSATLSDTACLTTRSAKVSLDELEDLFSSMKIDSSIAKTCLVVAYADRHYNTRVELAASRSTIFHRGCHFKNKTLTCACHTYNCQRTYVNIVSQMVTLAKQNPLNDTRLCLNMHANVTSDHSLKQLSTALSSAQYQSCPSSSSCFVSYSIKPITGDREFKMGCDATSMPRKDANTPKSEPLCNEMSVDSASDIMLILECHCDSESKKHQACNMFKPFFEMWNLALLDERLMSGKDTLLEKSNLFLIQKLRAHSKALSERRETAENNKVLLIVLMAIFLPLTILFSLFPQFAALRRARRGKTRCDNDKHLQL